MLARMPVAFVVLCLVIASAGGQAPARAKKMKEKEGVVGDANATAKVLKANGSKVDGLTLPDSFEVEYDEQFVEIQAQCKGPVTFLVLSTADRIKYRPGKKGETTITVGIPPKDCVVSVFAVGFLKEADEFTGWARCDIRVKGPPPTIPPPPGENGNGNGNVGNVPALGKDAKLHVTVVDDPRSRTPAVQALLNDAKMRQALLAAGHQLRIRDSSNANTKRLGFTAAAELIGLPALIIQINDGKPGAHPPVYAVRLPATAESLLALIAKLQSDPGGGRAE